ncbi:MAG: hypothetical protein JST04_02765 [Bdellovibrionales bacterium]|nr:hypothetical protein [Bdellovibrionales bacterium]
MQNSMRDRQARSRAAWAAYFVGLALLFVVGVTGGMWVSIRYFDSPVAENATAPQSRVPGRITGGLRVPAWVDHPYRHEACADPEDYAERAALADLSSIFLGDAEAALPPPGVPFAAPF